ncbi:MAG: hypothetical protein MUF34_34775 [Polyangiaceae bacterium]|jgi:hypothetical protein|nr:hypothetical protein [Polyangiaceae bacterium]
MNQTVNDLTNELKHEVTQGLERLQTLRDEVRVRLHLAGMDVKDRWNELEPHLLDAERAAQQFSDASKAKLTQALERLESFRSSLTEAKPEAKPDEPHSLALLPRCSSGATIPPQRPGPNSWLKPEAVTHPRLKSGAVNSR